MKPYLKKYWPIATLLLLIVTNPSNNAFKDYLGRASTDGLHRKSNYYIFSRYTSGGVRYVGVLGNFYRESIESAYRVENTPPPKKIIEEDTIIPIKLTITEFANRIKSKYPEYAKVDNKTLVQKILTKYPVYKSEVDTTRIGL